MVACILCLLDASDQQQIKIFSNEGLELNICTIISKHFWLKPKDELCLGQLICISCWDAVRDFDTFYQRVAKAHHRLDIKGSFVEEDDPLPTEMMLKSEQVVSAGQLIDALADDFFDSEVKVEVHDLDLLPQIEIIEGTTNLTDRAKRAKRRGRPSKDKTAVKTSPTTKRIKQEHSPATGNDNLSELSSDSEPELPLAVLMNVSLKTESADTTKSNTLVDSHKKRRGRPKKVKDELSEKDNVIEPAEPATTAIGVKSEHLDSDDNRAYLEDGLGSGTDDSSDSSSGDSDDESDYSLPDAKPQEQYAEIPKRVVVKPKKYRKRPKPLVPPRRMTREEIERKNAQQAEYDNVIEKFFGKFACPKCNLLVQNFGDMKKHFRASHAGSHNDGYMMCCGRKFHVRRNLAEHIYVHWNPEHFKCSQADCGRVCQDGRALEVHELTHSNPPEPKEKKVFQCDKCPKVFTTKAAFEYHNYSKHVPKSEFKYPCTECNKKLPTERKLKDHMRYMHDPESAVMCDKCGKNVRTKSNLKKHHQIEHSDVPRPAPVPMQCEICGTWLRHLSGLKQHMKTIHEDSVGEHRCHICNKTSTNGRALRRHIYHNHECERKFKCTMCEKAFKRPQDLREHTSVHTGEVLYTCPNCPMTFFSNANMYKHRQRLHRAEWEAEKKNPRPPNIMRRAVGATAAMKMQQAVCATSAFFAHKLPAQI